MFANRPARKLLSALIAVGSISAYVSLSIAADPPADPPKPAPNANPVLANGCTLSGPYTHDNLTVFLVHGPDRLAGKKYLTLQEALEQKKVVVHETGNVNELAVENNSDVDVFIQAGDIVRGGQQDRTLGNDLILGAKSGRVPIASFCVEQGRWTGRPGESAKGFNSSGNCLSSNSQKLAVKYAQNQQRVWDGVSKQQRDLDDNVEGEVKDDASPSSLELTLSNGNVNKAKEPYDAKFDKLIEGMPDVVGFVFAVNGEVTCGDIYAGPSLLKQLWPKLIDSAVVEAVSMRSATAIDKQTTADDVRKLMAEADRAEAKPGHAATPRTKLATRDATTVVAFETHDKEVQGAPVHYNCLRKSGETSGRGPQTGNQLRAGSNANAPVLRLEERPQQVAPGNNEQKKD